MMTHDEMIAVIAAGRDGKTIQFRFYIDGGEWIESRGAPRWNFESVEYREKPDSLECWCNIYDVVISMHKCKEAAIENAGATVIRRAVHMVEDLS